MTKFKALGAICVAAALATASPALARGIGGGGTHTGAGIGSAHAAPQFAARGAPQFAARGAPQFAGHNPEFRDHDHHHHFGPGFGLGAGALLGGYYDPYDAYAYDNSDDGYYYSDPSFVCQPGTWFVGRDGRRHICQ